MQKGSQLAITLTLTLTLVAFVGCGEERESSTTQMAADRRPNAHGVLPCTDKDEPTNFDAYFVGRRFEGLPLTDVKRDCTKAPRFAPPYVRQNMVAYLYGDCTPRGYEGRCRLPLQVQSRPRCEIGFSHHSSQEFRIRGVPARYQGGGLALLTGDAMVALFGTDEGRLLRATKALIKAPARPSDRVRATKAHGPLPPPKTPATGCAYNAVPSRKPPPPRPDTRSPRPPSVPPERPVKPNSALAPLPA